jgi:flagellar motor component MotA
VGPGIATATLALLYGVVVSEIVCIPVASASGGAPRSRTIPALMAGLIAVVCLLQGGMLLLAFA